MKRVVAGVLLERTGGFLLRAFVDKAVAPWPALEILDCEPFRWDKEDPRSARTELDRIAKLIGDKTRGGLEAVSIASYGPFLSLKRSHPDFGKLHPTTSHLPLQGMDLFEIFRSALVSSGAPMNVPILVHTDAHACALGEAVVRNLPSDHLLAYMLVTEGVGIGIVTGRTIFSSALHPEIGLLHVRVDEKDPLKPQPQTKRYARSLSEMADNKALFTRGTRYMKRRQMVDREIIYQYTNDDLWDTRAYYVAQGCLAAAVILCPHQIVIGADIDPDGRLAERVRSKFDSFLRERDYQGQPVFRYDELAKRESFISSSLAVEGISQTARFAITGALGMCMAAATANRGGNPKQMPGRA